MKQLNLVTRIEFGVRYLDAVYPKDGEELSEYLNGSVLGLYGKLDGSLAHAFSETVVKDDTRSVIARTIIQDGVVGFPVDLQPTVLEIAERFRRLKGVHAILDTDGYHEHRDAFDLGRVEALLSILHSAVDNAFKATVTDHALKSWN